MTALIVLALLQQAKDPNPTQVTLFTWDTHRFAADLDEGGGDVEVTHLKFSLDIRQFLSRQDMLLLQTGVDRVLYDFSSDSGFGSEPWEDVSILRADLVYMRFFSEQWWGLAYGSLYDSAEDGADKGDAISYGAGVGLLYRSGPDFMIGAALRAVTRIEESPYVFLVPQIDWQFSPGWTLKTESRSSFTLTLSRTLDDAKHWAAEARTHFWFRRFRLDDDALIPEGVVEDDRFCLEAGAKWSPCASFFAGLYVGADLWQSYSLEAKNGNDIDDVGTDAAPYVSIALSASF